MQATVNEAAVLETFGLCILAFMVIVAVHLTGLHFAIGLFRRHFRITDANRLQYQKSVLLVLAAMMLLFAVHMMTNLGWGLFMFLAGTLPDYRQCVYYSLENYTSLGLTRVNVDDRWRMLAPMISLSGVFCLSWSTAVLVSFLGQLYSIKLDD